MIRSADLNLGRLLDGVSLAGLADGDLLDRFVRLGDDAALGVIVGRHGGMVWGVCLRILRDHHDAEDAFQATFAVLARRAGVVAPGAMVGPWLHGVARRTAAKMRATREARRRREVAAGSLPEPAGRGAPAGQDDLAADLDRELDRLPGKYRVPIVLCELEGLTHREAADQLGWPVGTVAGRLSRGRAILARQLARRGYPGRAVPLGLLATGSAPRPLALVASAVRTARLGLAGRSVAAGVLSARIADLTERSLRIMPYVPWKLVACASIPLGFVALVAGATVAARPTQTPTPPPMDARPPRDAPGPAVAVAADLAQAVRGTIARAVPVDRDGMVLAYLPRWDHGHVDNIAVANNGGGVRTLLGWPKLVAGDLAPPGRRYVLACY